MPCRDERDNDPCYEKDMILTEVRKELREYTAMMCALTNEVMSHPDGLQIIKDAEVNGKVNIKTFIKDHAEEDKERIKENIQENLSIHEINILKEMIKNNEL